MNLSRPFIERPVATTLLTTAVALAGALAYTRMPVSPLPRVEYPTVAVSASLPGADPETVSTSVAEPLERYLGQIAGITEITSSSSIGVAHITMQFDLSRDINGAARDVQAAINAAAADVSVSLPNRPTYRKVNPAEAPLMILALTSKTLSRAQIYDAASNVLQQRLSQLSGIGEVSIGGGALPAVRVELNPTAVVKYGIGFEDIRASLAAANANSPKGAIDEGERRLQLYSNDQANHAADYRPLVVAYRNGNAVRLSEVADVDDSVQDLRNEGRANGEPAVLVILARQPGANIIDTADQVKAELPRLQAALPADMKVTLIADRSRTTRAALEETTWTLLLAVVLVTGVVLLVLRDLRAAVVPAVVVPVSIIGTFGGMYLLGFSLDNLSLMALTIATGFVVDDAIVVLENISRHIEDGVPQPEAALRGTREVSFTVIAISLSLVAVFIPILLMGGVVGRLFQEFAVTLSLAVVLSMVISLTTTPMLCAVTLRDLKPRSGRRRSLLDGVSRAYERSLSWSLRHGRLVMLALVATVALNGVLFTKISKGFFPEQDTGLISGTLLADESTSFESMKVKLSQSMDVLQRDPAVDTVGGFTGGSNRASVWATLKPLSVRGIPSDEVIARLRRRLLRQVQGGRLFMQTLQDLRVGARQSTGEYQFTLQADNVADLDHWGPILQDALETVPEIADVNTDRQPKALQTKLTYDRMTAARLGLGIRQIDNTLYDAFGQRQVSVIYNALNQYRVVMEVAPRYWQSPDSLADIYVSTGAGSVAGTQRTNLLTASANAPGAAKANGAQPMIGQSPAAMAMAVTAGLVRNESTNAIANSGRGSVSTGAAVSTRLQTMVPLAAISSTATGNAPLSVNHQGLFAATTISFNPVPGVSLSEATRAVRRTMSKIHVPTSIHGVFAGTAGTFIDWSSDESRLIVAALLAVYLVLGVLYESFVHPMTILSTLPSAGLGAVLALMLWQLEFNIIGLIGVILLIGIVKKNAIMMIDFAIHAQRALHLSAREAIYRACLLRFRPIMMTTVAALLGAIPLALSYRVGGELRRPLGISIAGGLIVSQILTLYTTPVLYVYLERLRTRAKRVFT